MELVFTAIVLVLVGGACFLYQYLRGSGAICRRPMSEWLAHYALADLLHQQEMADTLLKKSVSLATRMGVQVHIEDLLPANSDASVLIERWQREMPGDFHATVLPVTPAQTVGALLVIRQLEPRRYTELMGEAKTR